jgi:hypothetical protein
VQHNYIVRNTGDAATIELSLWIVDGRGAPVSTRAGGRVVLMPGEAAHMTLEVAQPLPDEQELRIAWRDQSGEHTESTGLRPPKHM